MCYTKWCTSRISGSWTIFDANYDCTWRRPRTAPTPFIHVHLSVSFSLLLDNDSLILHLTFGWCQGPFTSGNFNLIQGSTIVHLYTHLCYLRLQKLSWYVHVGYYHKVVKRREIETSKVFMANESDFFTTMQKWSCILCLHSLKSNLKILYVDESRRRSDVYLFWIFFRTKKF